MTQKIAIIHGIFILDGDSEPCSADVLIDNGRIAAVGSELQIPSDAKIIDAKGMIVMPGGVDPHVHLHYPQGSEQIFSADDWRSGSVAAAMGGTTTILDFIEPKNETLLEAMKKRNDEAKAGSIIDYSFHMSIIDTNQQTFDDIPKIVAEGITSFKIYTAYDGIRLNYGQLPSAFGSVASAGGLSIVHSEDHATIMQKIKECKDKGYWNCIHHPHCHPSEGEIFSNKRLIEAALFVAKTIHPNRIMHLHIVHVTTSEGAQWIRNARDGNIVLESNKEITQTEEKEQDQNKIKLDITGEVCTHHIVLSDECYKGIYIEEQIQGDEKEKKTLKEIAHPSAFILSPPLRSPHEIDMLLQEVERQDSGLPFLTSDHCAFTHLQRMGQRRHPEIAVDEKGKRVSGIEEHAPWWTEERLKKEIEQFEKQSIEQKQNSSSLQIPTDHPTYPDILIDKHTNLPKSSLPSIPPPFYMMPGGGSGIEPRISLAYNLLVVERGWTLRRFVDFVSTAAAKRYGLYPRKGTLKVGSDADVLIFDPNAQLILSKDNSFMVSDQHPYEGRCVIGVPNVVIVKGMILRDKIGGPCLSFEPRGELLRRQPFHS